MARALQRILSAREQPEVLDLGQFSRSAAVYLANRGARVSVESFVPPLPLRRKKKTTGDNGERAAPSKPEPVVIPHEDGKFDLVLAWEHWDFVPPERLAEFAAEVGRVLAPGGWLVLYSKDSPGAEAGREEQAGSYSLVADDRMVRIPAAGPAAPRWSHPNRAIERALAPLAVQAIHLQPNRIREFLVRKPPKPS
ncbi:MAG: class I SAM-dependent methyltransferase [Planctomycetota bacterium]|jgi:SAM-dependent methyltransferase